MPTALPLNKMSKADKLRAMEALWADLTHDSDKLDSPAWHATALEKTEILVKVGKAKFIEWSAAKKMVLFFLRLMD